MRRLVVALALILSSTGCATHQAYLSPQFSSVTAAHRQVAILPFDVSISRDRLPRNLKPESVDSAERAEGYEIQNRLWTQLQRRSGEYTVVFQDVSQTNGLLERAGLVYDSLGTRSKKELAELLQVDAVISGRIERSKPMSTGAALIVGGLFPGSAAHTNHVGVDLQLHDGAGGALLWTFAHDFGAGLFSNPDKMAEALLGSVAQRFPYRRGAASGISGPAGR